jgi:hypothetical protein
MRMTSDHTVARSQIQRRVALILILIALLATLWRTGVASADENSAYQSRFLLAGVMLRSSIVCVERETIDALETRVQLAMRLLSAPPMREFSTAFPELSKRWQMDGSENFNRGVVSEGVSGACDYARGLEQKIAADVDFGTEDVVPLVKARGVYEVPVRINNVVMLDFIVDSGAADVTIPADVLGTLYKAGTIKPEDFRGEKIYQLADGSTVPSPTFVLRSMQLGSTIVYNVSASVVKADGPLLLGQSFLENFSVFSFDYEKKVVRFQSKQ